MMKLILFSMFCLSVCVCVCVSVFQTCFCELILENFFFFMYLVTLM
jgi:hypothetical protein